MSGILSKRLFDSTLPTLDSPALRPRFANALSRLMATPGASSDDPAFNRGPHPTTTATAPAPSGVNPAPDELEPAGSDPMAVDIALRKQTKVRLQQLAANMTRAMSAQKLCVSLLAPGNLTVRLRAKGYQQRHHIGGESFVATSVTLGRRGYFIFCFKPASVQVYETMEINEFEAPTRLQDFLDMADVAAGGDFYGELAAIRQLEAQARAAQAAKAKFADYPDFGSF